LQAQFQNRTTKKVYNALVFGEPKEHSGTIETFIGRHPKRRQEQAVLPIQVGERARREAITDYIVKAVYFYHGQPISLIEFSPKTGRMHQLRVHAKYIGTPILGDQTYTIKPAKRMSKEVGLTRQLLHAYRLTIEHPETHSPISLEAPLPDDMVNLLKLIDS
ncbi:MAG TPA: RluA family pseudouridine synthase, partial [Patescibacteria group bacterium]